MRKYIITPALLAIVCMVMCHCTFNRKASVAANEYLIQGELANLPDSIVIGLYEEDGSILNCVWRDTLMNGQFSFRDTVSTTRKMLIMSDNRGFPGTWLEVWIAPGEYIEIKGQDKLVKTWEVVSDVPEQQEENRFTACAMAQQKELMQYMAAEYDWQRMMFIDHPGDREFESQAWAKKRFYPETVNAVAAGNLEKGNGIHGRSARLSGVDGQIIVICFHDEI